MANTITISALTENIFKARDIVAREMVGFIPSVTINSGSEGVSIGGTVNSHVTAQPTLNTSITPAMTIPAGDDQTITTKTLTIGQTANVRIPLNGETFKQIANTSGSQAVLTDLFAQAIRKIVNTIEAHVGTVIKNGASRATGTAGTTPFGSNFDIIADARQILVDNGCPVTDGMLSAVINTAAGAKLRKLSTLYKANESGSTDLLRRGEILNILGFSIKESAGVASHTAGSGASYLINNGDIAVGSTSLTIDTGSGTILVGDIIALESDTNNKYVVASTSAGTTDLTLQSPGLQVATVNNKTVTLGAAYTGNVAFHKSAVELVIRPPVLPEGGDAAVEQLTVADAASGLVFDVSRYAGYKMNMLDITVYYQAKVWKPEFVATILG